MTHKKKTELHLVYPGYHGRPAACRATIYTLTNQSGIPSRVIVLAQLEGPDYNGLSVTNGFEKAATELTRKVSDTDWSRVIWIEHYPSRPVRFMGEETFDLVTLSWDQGRFSRPNWHHVSRAWVEELIKEEYE
jgi:hypothetical protein